MKLTFIAKDLTVFNPFICESDEVIVDTEVKPIDRQMVLLRNPENGEYVMTLHCGIAPAPKEVLIGVVERITCFNDTDFKRNLRLEIIKRKVA